MVVNTILSDIIQLKKYGTVKYLTPCALANVLKYYIVTFVDISSGTTTINMVQQLLETVTTQLEPFNGIVRQTLPILLGKLTEYPETLNGAYQSIAQVIRDALEIPTCVLCATDIPHPMPPRPMICDEFFNEAVYGFLQTRISSAFLEECLVPYCQGHTVYFMQNIVIV